MSLVNVTKKTATSIIKEFTVSRMKSNVTCWEDDSKRLKSLKTALASKNNDSPTTRKKGMETGFQILLTLSGYRYISNSLFLIHFLFFRTLNISNILCGHYIDYSNSLRFISDLCFLSTITMMAAIAT